jgi:hypothetical protein
MVDRSRVSGVLSKLAEVLAKCEATNKPGPCAENKPEPAANGKPAAAAKPGSAGRAPALTSYVAKPFKESPEAKAVMSRVAALKTGKGKVKDAALMVTALMKRKRDQADAAIAKAEQALGKLRDQKKAKAKIEGAKKLRNRAVAAVSKRVAKVTALIKRMLARGGESVQTPKDKPSKAVGADPAVAKAIAAELEGMITDADGFHQAAAILGTVS